MSSLQRSIDNLPRLYTRLLDRYGTDDRCRECLHRLVWPHGFVCRRCRSTEHHFITTRGLYECAKCKAQHSLTAGLPLHGIRSALHKWFAITFFVATGCTRMELDAEAETLGVHPRTLRRWLRKLDGHLDRDLTRFIQAFMDDLRTP